METMSIRRGNIDGADALELCVGYVGVQFAVEEPSQGDVDAEDWWAVIAQILKAELTKHLLFFLSMAKTCGTKPGRDGMKAAVVLHSEVENANPGITIDQCVAANPTSSS